MTFRSTLFLSACALGLFAFIYFFEGRLPEGDHKPLVLAPLIPGLDPLSVTAIEITRSNLVVRVQRTNDNWQLANPAYPAQNAGVESLLAAAAKAPRIALVSAQDVQNENGGLHAFGLEPPRAALTFQSSTGRIHLKIGGNTPIANRIYVQLAGSPDVLVTEASLLKHLPATADQWRDVHLLDLTALTFDTIQVQNGRRIFEIERNSTNQQWYITRPLPGRADSNRVEELMVRLQNARVSKFIADTPAVDLEGFGLQTPAATLSLILDTNTLATVEFGRSPTNDPGQIYARNLVRSNIVLVARELLDFLQQPYKNFHDPHLLELHPAGVTAIQVRAAESFDLEKRDAQWIVMPANIPADAMLVGAMLTNAANLEIVDFAKDVPTEADLVQYGLRPPRRQYTFLTLGTNLSGVTTNVPLVRLDFGNHHLDTIYAKRSDEAPVYVTTLAGTDELPAQAFQLRDRALWEVSPAAITNISFVFNDTTNRLTRETGGHWAADEILNASIEEAVFRIAQAKTPRWVAKGPQKAALFGLNISTSSMILGISDAVHPRQIVVKFGGRTAARVANLYASYTPEGESEPIVFEFPGAIYQDLVRLMTPTPR